MESRRKSVLLLFGLAVVLFGASSNSPAGPTPQATGTGQKPLRHEVTVVLKLFQVFVTDRKGDPVTDLRKEDFVVTDDGRPVDLTEFESHMLLPAGAPGPRGTEPPSPAPSAAPTTVTRLPNKFFVLFDFAYNNHRGIAKAKEAALRFLDTKIDADAEVGVLSLSMLKGLVIHEYLSTDHQRIRATVAALDIGEALSSGRADDIEAEYWRRMDEAATPIRMGMRAPRGQLPGRKSISELSSDRQAAKYQALMVLERISDLAKTLRNVPGQKHFIFFSTGVPGSMIHGHLGYAQSSSQIRGSDGAARGYDFGDPALRSASEDMYKELAASGCSVFSFDTREAALPTASASLFAYEEETFGTGNRDIFSEKGVSKPPVGFYKDDRLTGGSSIGRLSKRTGGEYFANINEFEKNLSKVKILTGNYYVLGFPIAAESDGRFHDLKVKVLRKGCEVRAQSGYYGPKVFRDYSDMEKGLHLIELALGGRSAFGTALTIPILPLAYSAQEGTRLEILARIPSEAIERFRGRRVEAVTLVFDGRQDLAALRRVEADVPENGPADAVTVSGCALKPGSYDCRVVVRDLGSGAAAVAAGKIELVEPPPEGMRVFSPLLLRPGGPSVYLESREGKGGAEGDAKGLGAYDFDRARFRPIVGDEILAGPANLAAVVPFTIRGILALRVDFEAKIVDPVSGKTTILALTSLSKPMVGTTESIFLEFSLAGVPPGSYDFIVSAVDEDSALASEARVPLKVK
ncbi:MAG: VWA domain-containing protein [Candidatus Aminicenantes bacterium]|nr:VWA domain-containing protein [Candidatus Aminicenantes bacterium]